VTATPFLQCRVDKETRARAEQAAAECEMPLGTWLREVVDGALEAHFDIEVVESETHPGEFYEVRRSAGTCTCLGFEHAGHCKHLDVPEPIVDPVLTEPVGPVPQVEHPGERTSQPEPLSERDCPHLPQWWRATGRCRCGRRMRGVVARW
jgi:hypothetical protein